MYLIKSKHYDIFDCSNMRNPEEMAGLIKKVSDGLEEDGWEMVECNKDYSVWVKMTGDEVEYESYKDLELMKEELEHRMENGKIESFY